MRSVDIPLPMNFTSTDSLNSGLPEAYFYHLAPTWLTHSLSSFTYAMRSLDLPPMVDSGLSNSQRHRRAGSWSYSPLTFFAWLQDTCFKTKNFQVHRCSMDCYQPPQLLLLSLRHLYIQLYQKDPNFYDAAFRPDHLTPQLETGG